MEQEHQDPKRRKGIYLLPNLFTTVGLFAGFYAIVAAMGDNFELAAIAIYVGFFMDGIDGRVARLTNTQSEFGAQYDSLSDMVCFGLAPSLVMYEWALRDAVAWGWLWAKLGWLAAFVYTAGTALRLARFNAQLDHADTRYFHGLPSPSAAALLAGLVWVGADLEVVGPHVFLPAVAVTVLIGLLMVSNFQYLSFKEIDFKNRVPFVVLLLVVGGFVFTSIDPPKVLCSGFLVYALSGPAQALWRWHKAKKAKGPT